MNYRILTGCFEGRIVEEGQILDVPFHKLDQDLQDRIKYHADMEPRDEFLNPDEAEKEKESYEDSWDVEETEEEADLLPVSEW